MANMIGSLDSKHIMEIIMKHIGKDGIVSYARGGFYRGGVDYLEVNGSNVRCYEILVDLFGDRHKLESFMDKFDIIGKSPEGDKKSLDAFYFAVYRRFFVDG